MTDVTMNGPVVTSIVATGQHAMQHNKSITITPSSKPPKNTPIYKCYATNIDSRLALEACGLSDSDLRFVGVITDSLCCGCMHGTTALEGTTYAAKF